MPLQHCTSVARDDPWSVPQGCQPKLEKNPQKLIDEKSPKIPPKLQISREGVCSAIFYLMSSNSILRKKILIK
jgi:hypothetical protein